MHTTSSVLHTSHTSTNIVAVLTVLTALVGAALLPHVLRAQTPTCNGYAATYAVPQGYGASYNPFSSTREMLLNASCGTTDFSVGVGAPSTNSSNFAVYQKGYRWTGSAWEAYTYAPDGGSLSGAYILGNAKPSTNLTYAGDHTYWVAFACTRYNGAWKCGCRDTTCTTSYWNLQVAVRPPTTTSGGTLDGGTGGTGGTTVLQCGDRTLTRKWNPPALQNPKTVTVTQESVWQHRVSLGTGDHIVTCGGKTIKGNLSVTGGNNIVVRDCKIVVQCDGATAPSYDIYTGINVNSFSGSFVSFENLHVDASNCTADAIVTNKKVASGSKYDVYFFNDILPAGSGHPDGLHADLFQDQNSQDLLGNLYIEHVLGGSWYSGFTAYYADNTYVRNSSVVQNSALGKICRSVLSFNGVSTICSADRLIHPSYTGNILYCQENAYTYGCAPCGGKSPIGTCINDPKPHNYTCLPPELL